MGSHDSSNSGSLLNASAPVVVLGRIGAPFGLKGGVHVHLFTETDCLLNYKTWQLLLKEGWRSFEVLTINPQDKSWLVHLSGIETREQAQTLTHSDIGLSREELPELPENEYYWVDLIGLTVITEKDEVLGQVDHLFETGSNDVLVVKNPLNESKEHLIPYLPGDYILEVSLKERQLRVRWDPEF